MTTTYIVGSLVWSGSVVGTNLDINALTITGLTVGNLYMATTVGNFISNKNTSPVYKSTQFVMSGLPDVDVFIPSVPGWGTEWRDGIGIDAQKLNTFPPYVPYVRLNPDGYHVEVFFIASSSMKINQGDYQGPGYETWSDDNDGICNFEIYNASIISGGLSKVIWWN
jgi:hypothetical protein